MPQSGRRKHTEITNHRCIPLFLWFHTFCYYAASAFLGKIYPAGCTPKTRRRQNAIFLDFSQVQKMGKSYKSRRLEKNLQCGSVPDHSPRQIYSIKGKSEYTRGTVSLPFWLIMQKEAVGRKLLEVGLQKSQTYGNTCTGTGGSVQASGRCHRSHFRRTMFDRCALCALPMLLHRMARRDGMNTSIYSGFFSIAIAVEKRERMCGAVRSRWPVQRPKRPYQVSVYREERITVLLRVSEAPFGECRAGGRDRPG